MPVRGSGSRRSGSPVWPLMLAPRTHEPGPISFQGPLHRDDVDLEQPPLRVRGNSQKTHKIEVEKRGIQAIKSQLAVQTDSLHTEFFLNYQGEPLSECGVRKMLVKYLNTSDITKKASSHSLRHTFTTRPSAASALLDHSSLNSGPMPRLIRRCSQFAATTNSWYASSDIGRGWAMSLRIGPIHRNIAST